MNALFWSNIESRFVEKFDKMFSSNSKKVHFDCVPNEFSVVDGARSKWSQLLLINALVAFIHTESFNLATRRKFDQQKILKECIKLEIESLKSSNLWNETSCYTIDIDSESNWIDVSTFRKFLEKKYPFKSKDKYFGIMNLLLEHEALRIYDYHLVTFINAAINKIIKTPIMYKKELLKQQKIEYNNIYKSKVQVFKSQSKKRTSGLINASNIVSYTKCSPSSTGNKRLKRKLTDTNDNYSMPPQVLDCSTNCIIPFTYLSAIKINDDHHDSKLNQQIATDELSKLITLTTNTNCNDQMDITPSKVSNTKRAKRSNLKTKVDETIYSFNADKVFEDNDDGCDITQQHNDKLYYNSSTEYHHEDIDSQPWILLESTDCSSSSSTNYLINNEEDLFTTYNTSNTSKVIDEIAYHCTISKSPAFSITITEEDSVSTSTSTTKTSSSSIYKVHLEPFPVNNEIASIRFLPF